jgi:hypothetical protein
MDNFNLQLLTPQAQQMLHPTEMLWSDYDIDVHWLIV